MAAATNASRSLTATALVVVGILLAILLGGLISSVNLSRSCVTGDTPYFDLCPQLQSAGAPQPDALRARIAADPGDANAYVQLAIADKSSPQAQQSAAAAQRVTPSDPNVQMQQAVVAIERQDLPASIEPLIQLTEHRDNKQSALVLARLVGAGQGNLLSPFLTPGSRWFSRVLAQMGEAKAPFSSALPLVVQALKLGILDVDTVRGYIRQLKASGAWADAFGLWLSVHGKSLPALYNGSFEEAFQPDGFDWEVTISGPASKTGALVERRGAEQHGSVLDIQFTGRAMIVPLVRQYMFLGEGRYRLRGQYTARQFRMEEGLAWTVRCSSAAATQAGRSPALMDTGGTWRPFEFEFTLPPDCGLVASLQLETFAPFEAKLGARGRMAFDAFSLEKLRS